MGAVCWGGGDALVYTVCLGERPIDEIVFGGAPYRLVRLTPVGGGGFGGGAGNSNSLAEGARPSVLADDVLVVLFLTIAIVVYQPPIQYVWILYSWRSSDLNVSIHRGR